MHLDGKLDIVDFETTTINLPTIDRTDPSADQKYLYDKCTDLYRYNAF